MRALMQDLRYGVRMLAKSPGFTAIAVLTLALGIGANTAIFSIINSVLLKNLPVQNPQQLVFLTNPDEEGAESGFADGSRDFLTYAEFRNLERDNTVFSGLLGASSFLPRVPADPENAGESAEGATTEVSLVSGSYFSVLGVRPALGNLFTTAVDAPRDANPVTVISYGFWQDRFAGAQDIIGRKIRILRTPFEVIGVAPKEFHGHTVGENPGIWVPLSMEEEVFPGRDYLTEETNRFHKTEWVQAIGRMKPGVTMARASAAMNLEFQQLMESQTGGMTPEQKRKYMSQRLSVTAGSHGASTLRADFAKPLQILMAVVGLILLIACANVANLLMARSAARQKEIAVRVAMGAGTSRLFRQVFTESILLAGIGGATGLLFANWAEAALVRMVSSGSGQIPIDAGVDGRMLAFTAGVSVLTGILFGIAPAFRAIHVDLNSILKGTSRAVAGGGTKGGRVSAGKALVVAQVGLSLVLLIVAGLFVRSFRNLSQVELGYDRDHLAQFDSNPLSYGYERAALPQMYRGILQGIGSVPGVRSVSLSDNGLLGGTDSQDPFSIEGQEKKPGKNYEARWDIVGPRFFSTTGIPIVAGREITEQDSGSGGQVGVINQSFARMYFPDSSPIGQRILVHESAGHYDFTIVGVAADSKHGSVRERPFPRFYVPFFAVFAGADGSGWQTRATVIVRTTGDPSTVFFPIRDAVKQAAANLPPVRITSLRERVAASLATDRMVTQLAGAFGTLAVILVCIGLYGIMAFAVSGRINEIGIRIALGAQRGNVLWLVLRDALLLVLGGVALGLPATYAAGKWVASLLYGVKPADPATVALGTALMFVIGALACYVPARRAMRVDPMVALRYE